MPRISGTGPALLGRTQIPSLAYSQGQTKTEKSRYDQIQLSRQPDGMERQVMELTGRLNQQVKASHTAGQIADLKQQVSQGTYQLHADQIAARMLLLPQSEDGGFHGI